MGCEQLVIEISQQYFPDPCFGAPSGAAETSLKGRQVNYLVVMVESPRGQPG